MVSCPFADVGEGKPRVPTGQERVRVLYEEYIHLEQLRQVWDTPVTEQPELEPCFAAALHGIELCFLLLAEFLRDDRKYVAKRPRIEQVANDIRAQCQLLSEIVNGELEEAGGAARLALTQDFPFEGCPPTTDRTAQSPGIAHVLAAIQAAAPTISPADRNSLIKVVLNICYAFTASFQRWTVGLGVEPQLNELLATLGLPPLAPLRGANLDYQALVRPAVVEATLTQEEYHNSEDFFFRSVHLGTECWMSVALRRVASAAALSARGDWHTASARILQAGRVLSYLGEHVMALTSMNLRDYLLLKVELEGTSGAGSSQVRAIKSKVLQLLEPLKAAAMQLGQASGTRTPDGRGEDWSIGTGLRAVPEEDPAEERFERGLMQIYESPDRHPGLYNYAKALEAIESSLLGGFYYRHFCLAANVIGSEARGTMNRAVAALKATYERALFPCLDHARSSLGRKVDAELAHMKGRLMTVMMDRHLSSSSPRSLPAPPPAPAPGTHPLPASAFTATPATAFSCPFAAPSAAPAQEAPACCFGDDSGAIVFGGHLGRPLPSSCPPVGICPMLHAGDAPPTAPAAAAAAATAGGNKRGMRGVGEMAIEDQTVEAAAASLAARGRGVSAVTDAVVAGVCLEARRASMDLERRLSAGLDGERSGKAGGDGADRGRRVGRTSGDGAGNVGCQWAGGDVGEGKAGGEQQGGAGSGVGSLLRWAFGVRSK